MENQKVIKSEYVRYVDSGIDPIRMGFAMFVEIDKEYRIKTIYGDDRYVVKATAQFASVEIMRSHISDLIADRGLSDINEQIGTEFDCANDLLDYFNPADIVDGAEAYDNLDAVHFVLDEVIEPREYVGLRTEDGAVVFDGDLIEKG